MWKIKELLKNKLDNFNPSSELVEKEASGIIKEALGLENKASCFEVSYKKPDLVIKTLNSVLKNEIFLKKDKLSASLIERLGKKSPLKIWFR